MAKHTRRSRTGNPSRQNSRSSDTRTEREDDVNSDSPKDIDEATYKDEENETLPYRYTVTSYGADYPVDSLVKRIDAEDIEIPPFQRGFVWGLPKASRFIESLLLGLPVPGIFLARDEQTNKLLVIDGQQRLRTLQYFYNGIFADSQRAFALTGLRSQQQADPAVVDFEGATYKSLDDEDRRRLDDSIIHATIVHQDKPSEDNSSIYHIFERLNTGGVTLLPQEIRACIFHGPFNDLLAELNENTSWRHIYGSINKRMRDQELILRFFALYHEANAYVSPMKEFLNKYMGRNRELSSRSTARLRRLFDHTISSIHEALGGDAFRPVRAFNAAVFDAVMVGVAKALEGGKIAGPSELKDDYRELLDGDDFTESSTTGTTQEGNVRQRLQLACEAFARES